MTLTLSIANIEKINSTSIEVVDRLATMDRVSRLLDPQADRLTTAEIAECTCPDPCDRDHEND